MAKLKLLDEMPTIYAAFAPNKSAIQLYAKRLKAKGGYKSFERRLTWDCLYDLIGVKTICEWYGKYNVNNIHIYNAARSVLKKMNVI